MKEIDVNGWNRKKIFEWFEGFSNACWSITKKIDVSEVVKYTKESKTSFFINFLYIATRTLNSFECMKMRYINGKPVVFDSASPAYTVSIEGNIYENTRHPYKDSYKEFYEIANREIENTKKGVAKQSGYNPNNLYDEFYLTCLPWTNFNHINHPIPDDKGSQSVPRICWGKYEEKENKFVMDFNINVNHMFCDGQHVSMFLLKLQENINNVRELIK